MSPSHNRKPASLPVFGERRPDRTGPRNHGLRARQNSVSNLASTYDASLNQSLSPFQAPSARYSSRSYLAPENSLDTIFGPGLWCAPGNFVSGRSGEGAKNSQLVGRHRGCDLLWPTRWDSGLSSQVY